MYFKNQFEDDEICIHIRFSNILLLKSNFDTIFCPFCNPNQKRRKSQKKLAKLNAQSWILS